jgi:hypothetical protein
METILSGFLSGYAALNNPRNDITSTTLKKSKCRTREKTKLVSKDNVSAARQSFQIVIAAYTSIRMFNEGSADQKRAAG